MYTKNRLVALAIGLVFTVVHNAPAATVTFGGVGLFDSLDFGPGGAGSIFGGGPPGSDINFHVALGIDDSSNPGAITAAQFTHDGPAGPNNISFFDGATASTENIVTVTEGGMVDSVAFNIQLSSDGGVTKNAAIAFTFFGDYGDMSGGITDININKLDHSTTTITFIDATSPFSVFSGTVTAVPEPGSVPLIAGLFGGVYVLRRRRRRARNPESFEAAF